MGQRREDPGNDLAEAIADRRREELERDPDELRADDAGDLAEMLAGMAGPVGYERSDDRLVVRDGREVAAAIHESSDRDKWTAPPPVPPEHVDAWVAHHVGRPSELAEEAFRILGHLGTWCALAMLEEPDPRPEPTASLTAQIERYRTALAVIEESAEAFKRLDEDDEGATLAPYPEHSP